MSTRWIIAPLILYLVGMAAFAYGWLVYWRSGLVAPDPFVLASICVLSGAGVQVFHDLWARVRRWSSRSSRR